MSHRYFEDKPSSKSEERTQPQMTVDNSFTMKKFQSMEIIYVTFSQITKLPYSSASGETAKSRSSARQVRQCRKSMTCTAWPCMYARRRKRCWQSCGKNWSGISRLTKASVPFIYSLTSAESISFFILFTHRLFIIEEQKKGKELWQSEKSES